MTSPFEPQVNFGFKKVSAQEKTKLVKDVFQRVADRYDLMNDIMSGGIHRLWKKKFIHRIGNFIDINLSYQILDVAGGTGDLAFRFLNIYPKARVTVCDLTSSMMEVGRDRGLDQGICSGINWVCGDASQLPFPDSFFDFYSSGFGLRNVTDRGSALQEAFRVLKPGAHFFCLEFSKVLLPILQKFYHLYSFTLIPKFGKWIAGDEASYQYLVESIHQFPSQEKLKEEIEQAGFKKISIYNLSGGIAAIHHAIKI